MASTKQQHKTFWGIVHRLTEYSGLDESLVQNIVIYASCLTKKESTVIEKLVFSAQLLRNFNIVDKYLVDRIYHVIRKNERVSIEEFAYLICTFLTDDFDTQINFVFRIFDLDGDGTLDEGKELYTLLYPAAVHQAADDDDVKDIISDLTNYVIRLFDKDNDRSIDLEEFRERVKEDNLLIHCLGRCLPYTPDIELFKQKLMTLDPRDAMRYFSSEREQSLGDPQLPKKHLYPIELDCPIGMKRKNM